MRAGLVKKAEAWRWSSLGDRQSETPLLETVEWPVDRPRNWTALANQPMDTDDTEAVRTSITRDRPFGSAEWVSKTAKRLGLGYTLRGRGRPKKKL